MSLKKWILSALTILMIAGAVLTGGCAGIQVETPSQIIKNINPQEAFTLIEDNKTDPDFVILDVRTKEEVDAGYIENAINIDFYSDTFREELNKLDKDKKYLIYCRSGNRSGQALAIMKELNFKEVYNMVGGIDEWQAERLPTVK